MTSKAPATPDYLARRLARIRWPTGVPAGARSPRSRLHLVATCRAELEWATERWRAEARDVDEWACRFGPHPSEAGRLPHEMAAAARQRTGRPRLGDLQQLGQPQPAAAAQRHQLGSDQSQWRAGQQFPLDGIHHHALRRPAKRRPFSFGRP